jgi:hypothetical protein
MDLKDCLAEFVNGLKTTAPEPSPPAIRERQFPSDNPTGGEEDVIEWTCVLLVEPYHDEITVRIGSATSDCPDPIFVSVTPASREPKRYRKSFVCGQQLRRGIKGGGYASRLKFA